MRRKMPCWTLSEDRGTRTIMSCGLSDEILCDAAEKWPAAEIEIAHAGDYALMPGFGRTGIPLGRDAREVEATLRRLLTA